MEPPPRQAQEPALAGKPQARSSTLGGVELVPGRQESTQQQVANSKSPVNSSHWLLGNTSVNHIQDDGHGGLPAQLLLKVVGRRPSDSTAHRGFPRAFQVSNCCSGGWGGGREGAQPKKAQHQDKCLREFKIPGRPCLDSTAQART